jgi:hypothetical protein
MISASGTERVSHARQFLLRCAPASRVLIVGASRGAADDLARDVAARGIATFGIQRLTLLQLAARTALTTLATHGQTPSTWLGAEAVATRAVFEARRDASMAYLAPVAGTPGFARALARTLQELRLAGIRSDALTRVPQSGADLGDLLDRVESCFARAGSVDRAALYRAAAPLLAASPPAESIVLLDVPVEHGAERELVAALVRGTASVLATIPDGDVVTTKAFVELGASVHVVAGEGASDLHCLRTFLFNTNAQPPERTLDGSLEFFSAPGEGRECVEIARRILKEARRGARFDEMAILVRSPHSYFGLLEHALKRADVPAWFDRGTRRPHPAGRAFLALLACAAESLSASRFAEYLSLGQVPRPDQRDERVWAASEDEAFGRRIGVPYDELERETVDADAEQTPATLDAPVGTLRAPWKWERMLVEAAVIGRDAARWRRRLDGLQAEYQLRIKAAGEHDEDEARVRRLQQDAEQLESLRAFALPIVETLSKWPSAARWGEWLDAFELIAPRVLRMPAYVLRVLADLRPMADVGPIDLDEARRVLGERLLMLETEPPARRFGRVFVGTPQQARGRSFRVVFVPGLAERLFPQKPREDPLLLDAARDTLDASLPRQHQRLASERLLLQIAAGAAEDRLFVSYPRIELSESRARVPSFYALDIIRAAKGRLPHHEELEADARAAGRALLAWPAPLSPDDAIDDQEHDLAVLRRLLDVPDRSAVKGSAHYLLRLNECLRRSVIDRWARADRRWSPNDGLIRVTNATRDALGPQRLHARSYSVSALQRFASCPYQFLLSAVYKLQPLEHSEALQRLDPLTRGSVFHEIQATFFRALAARGALPVTVGGIDAARATLDMCIDQVAASSHEQLAPAVERVWIDEIASIRRDLHSWLDVVAQEGEEWEPKYFEFSFGTVPGVRDAHSVQADALIDGRFRLRGAIDLIEEHRQTKLLRITDHKTGRKPEGVERAIVAGGTLLQPVLYGMAIENVLDRPVSHSRLFYCTSAGAFHQHPVPVSDTTRRLGLDVLETVDRAIEQGFLAAAPAEHACERCDFMCICGTDEFRRVRRKPQDALADLIALRSRP